jgi:type II secretory pathway pseudopilin PulG
VSTFGLGGRRRSGRDDEGIALIELIVSMVVMLIMLTLIARMFAQVTNAADDNQHTRSGIGIAGTAMDEITRVIRQGARVNTSVTATEGAVLAGSTSTSLSIDSYVDSTIVAGQAAVAPTRVVLSVDASGNLNEARYAGTVTNGYVSFSSTSVDHIGNGPILTASGTTPLFAYTDGDGAAIVPGSSGLSQAQALRVAAVTVSVTVTNALSSGDDPVQLVNQVTMPNIAIVNGGY